MFLESEIVGHAGDVIRDGARVALAVAHVGARLPLGRKLDRIGHVSVEQGAHDVAGPGGHRVDGRMSVHAFEKKPLDRGHLMTERNGKGDDRMVEMPDGFGRCRMGLGDAHPRFAERIADHGTNQAADKFAGKARGLDARMLGADRRTGRTDERQAVEIVQSEKPGAQPVVEIVRVVGDIVGKCRDLRLGAGKRVEFEIVAGDVFGDRRRQRRKQRPVVLDDTFEAFPGQVQAVEADMPAFELRQNAQRLRVVVEPAIGRHGGVQRLLARMAETGVAEIVGKRHAFGQVLVQPERAGERAGDLRHLERMGQARAEMIALVRNEDLRLVLESPEGRRMDHPIAVALEGGTQRAIRLGHAATPAKLRKGCENRPLAPVRRRGTRIRLGWENPLHGPGKLTSGTRPRNVESPCPARGCFAFVRILPLTSREQFLTVGDDQELPMTDTALADTPKTVNVTESAAKRIAFILSQEEHKGMMLRISVSGGGCSGFQYGFTFDDSTAQGDLVVERDGATVVIDETSLELLGGSQIDYVEDMIGASFQIKNPIAKTSCGCGNSFSV